MSRDEWGELLKLLTYASVALVPVVIWALLFQSPLRANDPEPDTRVRFHATGSIQIGEGRCGRTTMRVEDLGSHGHPTPDPAYRNRWHYLIYGCQLPLLDKMWTTVTSYYTPGEMHLNVAGYGTLHYVPLDPELRPTITVSESNWQRVTVTQVDPETFDLLVEEPEKQ